MASQDQPRREAATRAQEYGQDTQGTAETHASGIYCPRTEPHLSHRLRAFWCSPQAQYLMAWVQVDKTHDPDPFTTHYFIDLRKEILLQQHFLAHLSTLFSVHTKIHAGDVRWHGVLVLWLIAPLLYSELSPVLAENRTTFPRFHTPAWLAPTGMCSRTFCVDRAVSEPFTYW